MISIFKLDHVKSLVFYNSRSTKHDTLMSTYLEFLEQCLARSEHRISVGCYEVCAVSEVLSGCWWIYEWSRSWDAQERICGSAGYGDLSPTGLARRQVGRVALLDSSRCQTRLASPSLRQESAQQEALTPWRQPPWSSVWPLALKKWRKTHKVGGMGV